MADFNSTTFFLRSVTSLFDVLHFNGVLADDLVVVLEDVLLFLDAFLVVVEEGALLQIFGAGRVEFFCIRSRIITNNSHRPTFRGIT